MFLSIKSFTMSGPPELPPELLISVFGLLESPDVDTQSSIPDGEMLRNVCLVSRLFKAIAQPLLFQLINLSYSNDDPEDEGNASISRLQRLNAVLDDRPKIATWIKRLIAGAVRWLGRNPQWQSWQEGLCGLVARVDSLLVVELKNMEVAPALLTQLYRQVGLERLILSRSWFPTDLYPNSHWDGQHNILTLRCITMEQSVTVGREYVATTFFMSPVLEEVHVDFPFTNALFGLATQHVLDPSSTPYMFSQLRVLDTHVPDYTTTDALISVLAASPALEWLTVQNRDMIHLEYSASPELDPDIVSRLQKFTGIMGYAERLVPGRPIHTLDLEWPGRQSDPEPTWTRLTEGTVAVRSLAITRVPWKDNRLLDILSYFPALEKFSLSIERFQDPGASTVVSCAFIRPAKN